MPRLPAIFRTSQTARIISAYNKLRTISSVFAVLSVIACSSTFAKDPEDAIKSKKAEANSQATTESCKIPECLEKLKLSSKQEEQIKEIIQSYDGSIGAVWKQFGDRYMKTITMEAAMLAAIEDSFTDAQRQKIRDHRRMTAQHEQAAEATHEKQNKSTEKSGNVVKNELSDVGVTLTAEQQAKAEEIQHQYRQPLRTYNREIHGMHDRLLALEAEKLVAIEKVLTKEQLSELRTNRQTLANDAAASANKVSSTKSD